MKQHDLISRRSFLAATTAGLLALASLRPNDQQGHTRRFTVNGQRVVVVDGWVFTEAEFVQSRRTSR